jgi:hypothetical protein
MKIITEYGDFLNEKIQQPMEYLEILDLLKDTPSEDIIEFRDSLGELVETSEKLTEGFVGDIIDKLKRKFYKVVDDKIWNYLINRKKDFYNGLIDKLNIFDLTTLDDVFINHPNFKLDALYLAGGMDKAVDVGAGWRYVVENEFEKYPGKSTGLPEINLGEFGEVEPKRVVDGVYVDMFIEKPAEVKKLYDKPLILNPVRKEVDRTKDKDFAIAAKKYKTFDQETEPEEYEPTMTNIRKTLTRSIEFGDEHLVRLCDGIFLGLNTAAAAGTYGELQTQSFMNKPIFVYMSDKNWSFSDFSMWSFPHFSKLARTEDEMKTLVATIMSYE